MTVAGRGLCMTIDGEKIQDGVPLQLLATVFGGVQNTIYYIAMAESGVTHAKDSCARAFGTVSTDTSSGSQQRVCC